MRSRSRSRWVGGGPVLMDPCVTVSAPRHRQGVWGQGGREESVQQPGQRAHLPQQVRHLGRVLQVSARLPGGSRDPAGWEVAICRKESTGFSRHGSSMSHKYTCVKSCRVLQGERAPKCLLLPSAGHPCPFPSPHCWEERLLPCMGSSGRACAPSTPAISRWAMTPWLLWTLAAVRVASRLDWRRQRRAVSAVSCAG